MREEDSEPEKSHPKSLSPIKLSNPHSPVKRNSSAAKPLEIKPIVVQSAEKNASRIIDDVVMKSSQPNVRISISSLNPSKSSKKLSS